MYILNFFGCQVRTALKTKKKGQWAFDIALTKAERITSDLEKQEYMLSDRKKTAYIFNHR